MPTAYCPTCLRTWPKPPGKPCPVDGTLLQSFISGKLFIAEGTASVAGRKLARGGGEDSYHKAIEFLSERGFRSGDLLMIAGARTRHQGKTVFVVHDARAAAKKKSPKSIRRRRG